MEGKKQTIFLSVIGIATLLVAIVGATFAWFSTTIEGEAQTVEVSTVSLGKVVFETSNAIALSSIYPAKEAQLTEDNSIPFTVTATDNDEAIEYNVVLNIDDNELSYAAANATVAAAKDSFVHKLTCTGTGTAASLAKTAVPTTTSTIATGTLAANGDEHTCTYTIWLDEVDDDQNELQGKNFTGTLEVVLVDTNKYTAGGTVWTED